MLLDALQVTLENCPGEIFINVSPAKCWSMVRERLNMEIRRQLSTGRANLPALQPPGSVDGFEMFGLLSPAIVQVRKVFTWPHSETHYTSRNGEKKEETLKHTNAMSSGTCFQVAYITAWWFRTCSACGCEFPKPLVTDIYATEWFRLIHPRQSRHGIEIASAQSTGDPGLMLSLKIVRRRHLRLRVLCMRWGVYSSEPTAMSC